MKTKRLFAFDVPIGKAINPSFTESWVQPSSPTLYHIAPNRVTLHVRNVRAKRPSTFDLSVEKAMHLSSCVYTTNSAQSLTETTSPERSRSSSSAEKNWCIETIVSGEEESKDGIPREQQVPDTVTAKRQNVFMTLHLLLSVIVVACMAWDRYSKDSELRIKPQLDGQLKHDLIKELVAYLEDEIKVDGIHPQDVSAVDTVSLGECPSDAEVHIEALGVIVAACVTWDRRNTALLIEQQLVGKITHVVMKEPSTYFEEEINTDDMHPHNHLARVTVSLGKYASDTKEFLKRVQFLTTDTFKTGAKHARKASFELKKQAGDTAAVQKSKFEIIAKRARKVSLELGKQVNDTTAAQKAHAKHVFGTFAKHALKGQQASQ